MDSAISDLERYLLKSNIVSGDSELDAEIVLEERERTDIPEPERVMTVTIVPIL